MKLNGKNIIVLWIVVLLIAVISFSVYKKNFSKNSNTELNQNIISHHLPHSDDQSAPKTINQIRDVLWALNPSTAEFEAAWRKYWENETRKLSTKPLIISNLNELPFAKDLWLSRNAPGLDEKQSALLFLATTVSNLRTELLVNALKDISTDQTLTEKNTIIMSVITTAAGSALERPGQFHLEEWVPLLSAPSRCARFAAAEWIRISSLTPANGESQNNVKMLALAEKMKMKAIAGVEDESDPLVVRKLIEIAQNISSQESTEYLHRLHASWETNDEIASQIMDVIQFRKSHVNP